MTNDILLAIPARGGSKRLPRKNLLEIDGRPMIAHTIEAAQKSKLADTVYVCTEDDAIAKVAEQYGASVFRIPAEMAEDNVSSTTPCLALYDHMLAQGQPVEYLFNLQPSSPLRTADDITGSLARIRETDADYLVSVTPIDPHYFHWALLEKDGDWAMYFGAEFLRERLYLPDVYRPNGAIKLARAARLRETGHYFGKNLTVYEMPEERSIHVATRFDFLCVQGIISVEKD